MLKISPVDDASVPGVSIYGDDQLAHVFYAISSQPTFRLDDHGKPVFRFIKYRLPLDRPDGKRGGALVAFDVEFAVSPTDMAKVVAAKQAELNAVFAGGDIPRVQVGQPLWMRGNAALNMSKDDVLIQNIVNPAHPSLYGKNVTPFFLELTPEGASIFESALQGQGGFVQVTYELIAAVGCPVSATARYDASKAYEFEQHYVSGKHWDGDDKQVNNITEKWRTSGAEKIDATFPPGTPPALQAEVMGHLYKFLDSMVTGNPIGDIAPADRGTGDQDIDRHYKISKKENFTYTFHENQAIEWPFNPQGTLPNITSIPGVKWADYATEVDPASDPFYKSIDVAVRVDADWDKLPIHSVDVTIDYGSNTGKSYHFSKAEDVWHFRAYTSDNNGSKKYKYSYKVNYDNEAQTLDKGPIETGSEELTITVGELGIFDTTVVASGAIDFAKVPAVEVKLHYEDHEGNVEPFDEVIVLDKGHQQVNFQSVVFTSDIKPFIYHIKYITADGPQYSVGPRTGLPGQLFIDGPFTNTETINVRVMSNFDTLIDTVFLDLNYSDTKNSYSLQKSMALSKDKPFMDWAFPVVDISAGRVSYSGAIKYKDGTSEDVAATTLTPGQRTIKIGSDDDFLHLLPITDLIDWTQVKLAKVDAHYVDAPNNVDKSYSWVLRRDATPQTYEQHMVDPHQKTFSWTATLYLATTPPTQQVIGPQTGGNGGFVVDPALAVPH
jgi:hypothetical protein